MRYFDDFRFDEVHNLLWQDDVRVPLTGKACAVLNCLLAADRNPVTKDEILRTVWYDTHVSPDNVKVLIREIRQALGDDARASRYVRTFPNGAYAFIASVHERHPLLGTHRRAVLSGRRRELATLTSLIPAQPTDRTVALVTSPPGLGKTVLCDQVLRLAER